MADRLTQLQDAVNAQADNFCNSIGILQQYAAPSSFPEFEKTVSKPGQQPQEDYPQLFASLIARTAKDIDVLIDSLPSEEASPELQEHLQSRDHNDRMNPAKTEAQSSHIYARKQHPKQMQELYEHSVDQLAANLRRLEVENQEAARRLEEVVQQGEALLEQIQKALHDIAESQLSMQHLDDGTPPPPS